MANHVSLRLSRLIRQRSYLSGEVVRAHQRVMDLTEEVAAARARLHQAQQELANLQQWRVDLDKTIRKEAPSIDPSYIQTVQETPRKTVREHGALIETVVAYLRASSNGVTTYEVARCIAPQFGLPWETSAEQSETVSRVRRIFNNLKKRGALKRLPSTQRHKGQELGLWVWIADAHKPVLTQTPTATGQCSDPS